MIGASGAVPCLRLLVFEAYSVEFASLDSACSTRTCFAVLVLSRISSPEQGNVAQIDMRAHQTNTPAMNT
jgi:hypothetical protein